MNRSKQGTQSYEYRKFTANSCIPIRVLTDLLIQLLPSISCFPSCFINVHPVKILFSHSVLLIFEINRYFNYFICVDSCHSWHSSFAIFMSLNHGLTSMAITCHAFGIKTVTVLQTVFMTPFRFVGILPMPTLRSLLHPFLFIILFYQRSSCLIFQNSKIPSKSISIPQLSCNSN